MYSFLTLDSTPQGGPHDGSWDGSAIYETMANAPILDVLNNPDYAWQGGKIKAMIEAAHSQGKKFIWAIGGWSDLNGTLKQEDIPNFVDKCVALLKADGDGIDFDWEHLSSSSDSAVVKEQRETLAEVMLQLRTALDNAGMKDKVIGYTTRFNTFMPDSKKEGFAGFASDGEGLTINNYLKSKGSSLNDIVSWVNIMAYDVPESQLPDGHTWDMDTYKNVLNTFSDNINPGLAVLGFEPGGQAADGTWEGMDVDHDAIDYVAENNYGGSLFWAINQDALDSSTEVTGLNADELAGYSQSKFSS